jgi:sirohydrochlorin ferrochelatase
MKKTGYLIFAHGSSVESANEAVRVVADRMARQGSLELVEAAFLEGGQPDLKGGVARLIGRGAERVTIIPYFLTLGLHLKRDLPKLVDEARETLPASFEVSVTEPLDGHPALVEILLDRAKTAA